MKNDPIEATELGLQTVEVLDKYCPEIQDEQLTRHFEEEMDNIREKTLTEDAVLEEAKKTLINCLKNSRRTRRA